LPSINQLIRQARIKKRFKVKARALQGNAASAEAHAAGARTRAIAEEGWRQAQRVKG